MKDEKEKYTFLQFKEISLGRAHGLSEEEIKLYAKSDMISFVDSLVAPLSVINALIAACAKEKKDNVYNDLKALEEIWDEYRVYSTDREGKQ